MQIFASYARPDRAKAGALAGRLTQLGHDVWLDEQLTGGQDWWGRILSQIRAADAVVLLLSPGALRSQACTYERGYAARLGKTMLPVLIEPVPHELLPADLARVQFVDYVQPGEEAAIRLARAMGQLRPAPALPDPLPDPPPVPLSYLSHLGQRLSAEQLPLEDQLDVVARLETALRASDQEERAAAATLLQSMRERRDLYAETARRLDRLAESGPSSAAPPNGPPSAYQQPAASQQGPPLSSYAAAGPGGPAAGPGIMPPPAPVGSSGGTSKPVKILAWIGGVVVALMVVGFCSAANSPELCTDYYGQVVPC